MTLDQLAKTPKMAAALSATQVTAALAQLHAEQGRLAALEGTLLDRLLALQAQPGPAEDELLDMPAVARRLGIPESRARELGRRGQLPTVQVGKYVRVSRCALEGVMAGGPVPVDSRPYAAYSRANGRRGAPAAPKARTPDPASARGPARGQGEHGRPVGAQ